jgi:hypothetical protein
MHHQNGRKRNKKMYVRHAQNNERMESKGDEIAWLIGIEMIKKRLS